MTVLHFPGQRPNEIIITTIRKHDIVYIKIILVFLAISILPLAIFFPLWLSSYPTGEYLKLDIALGLMGCAYLLFSMLITCIAWLNEEFDLFIITNERLIDITQVNFFKRTVASTPLEQIQDTTSNVDGMFATLLDYGDLEVQTAAGDASDFFIDQIPNPALYARQILNWAHEKRGNGELKESTIEKAQEIVGNPQSIA